MAMGNLCQVCERARMGVPISYLVSQRLTQVYFTNVEGIENQILEVNPNLACYGLQQNREDGSGVN